MASAKWRPSCFGLNVLRVDHPLNEPYRAMVDSGSQWHNHGGKKFMSDQFSYFLKGYSTLKVTPLIIYSCEIMTFEICNASVMIGGLMYCYLFEITSLCHWAVKINKRTFMCMLTLHCWLSKPTTPLNGSLTGMALQDCYSGFRGVISYQITGPHDSWLFPEIRKLQAKLQALGWVKPKLAVWIDPLWSNLIALLTHCPVNTKSWIKWTQYCRQHFQMHSQSKLSIVSLKFHWFFSSLGSRWRWSNRYNMASLGSGTYNTHFE